jgi:hypothetical protein
MCRCPLGSVALPAAPSGVSGWPGIAWNEAFQAPGSAGIDSPPQVPAGMTGQI